MAALSRAPLTGLVHPLLLVLPALLLLSAAGAPTGVGVLYNLNTVQAAQAQAAVARLGAAQLTTELVIRSNGALTLADVYGRGLALNLTNSSLLAQIYGAQPAALGFYCLYTARPTDPQPAPARDCENATGVARAHAAMLVAAGIDWVTLDATNWPIFDNSTYNASSATARGSLLVDATLVRPMEVLLDTWAQMRAEGLPTPRFAAWPCAPSPTLVPAARAMWRHLLDALYNDARYQDLVLREASGKKVFFMSPKPGAKGVQCFGSDTVALVEANGGRHDVAVTLMWAQMGAGAFAAGEWGFFSPCTDGGVLTSSIVDAPACAQLATTAGPGGPLVEVTASAGYMLAASGLPYGAPGHLRGLTLARQFEAVLAARAPALLLSSFNEHTGGRVGVEGGAPRVAFNMGLPGDPQRDLVWVDSYAAEFTRNLEPTVEGGGRVWEVLVACVALYRAGATCASGGVAPSDACCSRADKEVFASVWSLTLLGGDDRVLTASRAERAALTAAGWAEVCAPLANPTVFCVDRAAADGRDGPFIVYRAAGASPLGPTRPLLRCTDAASGAHSFTTRGACEGGGRADGVLGHVATVRGGEMLRALRRCVSAGGNATARSHALDLACDQPDGGGEVLGFVR
jgi:hypothetical protein